MLCRCGTEVGGTPLFLKLEILQLVNEVQGEGRTQCDIVVGEICSE